MSPLIRRIPEGMKILRDIPCALRVVEYRSSAAHDLFSNKGRGISQVEASIPIFFCIPERWPDRG